MRLLSEAGSLTLISQCLSFQDCLFHSNITSDLKAFTDKFGFDVLILIASYTLEEQQRQQIAVYSQNLELCSQVSLPRSVPLLVSFWNSGHVLRSNKRPKRYSPDTGLVGKLGHITHCFILERLLVGFMLLTKCQRPGTF